MSIDHLNPSISWTRRRLGAGLVAGAMVVIGLPLTATPALAATNPPVAPHLISVFPARDFVSASGFTAGDVRTVQILRKGFVVAHTLPITPVDDPKTAGFNGFVDVNHGGGEACFVGSTPNITPGDLVQVLAADGVTGDETTVAGVTVTQAATKVDATTVNIKGTAVSATNGQIPITQLEVRVVANQQAFVKSGVRTVRANSIGTLDGSLVYDFPGTTNTAWTATFTGMDGVSLVDGLSDVQRAVSPLNESRVMWNGVIPLPLTEQTIFEVGPGVAKGPGVGCPTAAVGPSMPDMTAATDTGISSADNITSNPRPTFGGLPMVTGATGVNLWVDNVLNGPATMMPDGSYSATPITPLAPGLHQVKAEATTAGAPEMSASLPFTIDTAKPILTVVAPTPNALTVSQIGNLSATFNENVFGANGSTFTLRKVIGNGLLTASVAYDPATKTATLNPATTLLPGTAYTAWLSSGIMDAAGNTLPLIGWTFKTAAAPTVTALSPLANATGVRRLANVTAIFSENVTGVGSTTFTLRLTSTGGRLTTVVGYNWRAKAALLNPSSTLLPNTRYTATLSTLIRDLDGNSIPAKSWTFTTGTLL